MGKLVFFCIPAHGHTNPTLGVVKELISCGHQVWYYSYNMMREKIQQTGATFISCDGYDMEQKLTGKEATRVGKDLAFSTKLLVDTPWPLMTRFAGSRRNSSLTALWLIPWHCGGRPWR